MRYLLFFVFFGLHTSMLHANHTSTAHHTSIENSEAPTGDIFLLGDAAYWSCLHYVRYHQNVPGLHHPLPVDSFELVKFSNSPDVYPNPTAQPLPVALKNKLHLERRKQNIQLFLDGSSISVTFPTLPIPYYESDIELFCESEVYIRRPLYKLTADSLKKYIESLSKRNSSVEYNFPKW